MGPPGGRAEGGRGGGIGGSPRQCARAHRRRAPVRPGRRDDGVDLVRARSAYRRREQRRGELHAQTQGLSPRDFRGHHRYRHERVVPHDAGCRQAVDPRRTPGQRAVHAHHLGVDRVGVRGTVRDGEGGGALDDDVAGGRVGEVRHPGKRGGAGTDPYRLRLGDAQPDREQLRRRHAGRPGASRTGGHDRGAGQPDDVPAVGRVRLPDRSDNRDGRRPDARRSRHLRGTHLADGCGLAADQGEEPGRHGREQGPALGLKPLTR